MLEGDKFLSAGMDMKVSKDYFRQLSKVLKSKLDSGRLVRGFNTFNSLY